MGGINNKKMTNAYFTRYCLYFLVTRLDTRQRIADGRGLSGGREGPAVKRKILRSNGGDGDVAKSFMWGEKGRDR